MTFKYSCLMTFQYTLFFSILQTIDDVQIYAILSHHSNLFNHTVFIRRMVPPK